VSSLNIPIYMDYSATTPVDERVAKKMGECLTQQGYFGNPASRSHSFGWQAEELVEEARENVAKLLGADPREIIWTSGATESDNLGIKGAAHFNKKKGKHIITVKTEHKAVLDTCRQLEREGFEVTYLDPMENGLLDLDVFRNAIREDTTVASVVVFHVDAAQSPGKVEIDVNDMNVDLMSLCAPKVYGPKGIGALYVRRKPRVRLEAQIHGGGHERGFRSGTLATHQIVGMGESFRIAHAEMADENIRLGKLRDRLLDGIKDLEEIYINGDLEQRIPGNLNISFSYVEGESLIMSLKDIAVSSGSACTSASLEPSYVLRALGRADELASSSIRFTLGRYSTEEEVDYTVKLIQTAVSKLRDLSPLWDMYKEGIDLDTVEWAHH